MEQDLVTPRNSLHRIPVPPSSLLGVHFKSEQKRHRTLRQAGFMESKGHSWVEQSTPALGLGAYPCF